MSDTNDYFKNNENGKPDIKGLFPTDDYERTSLKRFSIICLVSSLISLGSIIFVLASGGKNTVNDTTATGLMVFVYYPSYLFGIFSTIVCSVSAVRFRRRNKQPITGIFLMLGVSVLSLIVSFVMRWVW